MLVKVAWPRGNCLIRFKSTSSSGDCVRSGHRLGGTPSWDAVVTEVNVTVVESNVRWTMLVVGVPVTAVRPCSNPCVTLRDAFEHVVASAAELSAKPARTIMGATRIIWNS
jgi:hypothetical protein